MGVSNYFLVMTLNVNGLNSSTKSFGFVGWILKDPTVFCLQETYLTGKDMHRPNMKGWKMIFQGIKSQKQAKIVILKFDKVNF
jgi:exonuclease III